jgi:hypothetical protein
MKTSAYSQIGLLGLLGALLTASPQDLQEQHHVFHGTVNVAVGNRNGMVIGADGLLSGGPHPTFAQKLFLLDKVSACTIAGFYSTDDQTGLQFFQEPESAMHLEIRAIIAFLRDQLKRHPDLTINEKAQILAFQISSAIGRLNSIHDSQVTGPRRTSEGQDSQFLIAGYNPDGSAEIAKVSMNVDASGDPATIKEASLIAVRSELTWKTAGIEGEAIAILTNTTKPDGPERSDEALKALYPPRLNTTRLQFPSRNWLG